MKKGFNKNNLIEILAEQEHKQWIHWMQYQFRTSERSQDGELIIKKEVVERWQRLMQCEYKDLTEDEKRSDRDQAKEVVQVLEEFNVLMRQDKDVLRDKK